jgi:7,8-dihydropterin-6-yl-methyl-4-(beta-D-ribofuranosyl)aminobenzene 5'-phosphate synthase
MEMRIFFMIAGCMMIQFSGIADAWADPNGAVMMTVLYDNTMYKEGLQAEWGFSCLIEGTEKTILFDTGGRPDVLEANFRKLKIDPNRIDTVIISHMHWDHINGLDWLVKENPRLKILLPDSAPEETVRELQKKADRVERVNGMKCLCGGVFSTGTLPHRIPEQALCLETPEGLVVITGCSHPGIVRILERARELSGRDIRLAFGGFHFKDHTPEQAKDIIEEIRQLGVEQIGPTHCTGEAAIAAFKQAWGDDFIVMGVGRQIPIRLEKKVCAE